MKNINISLFFLLISFASIKNTESKCESHLSKSADLKTYIIDLDAEPKYRFQQVVNDFKEPINEWIKAEK